MSGSIEQLRKEIQMLNEYNDIDTYELERIADAIEREVEERYTELPKDENGKTVRYGGYVKVYPYDGKPMKVKALRLSGFGWSVVFKDGSRERLYRVLVCEPPTVEDVLREIVHKCQPTYSKGGSYTTGLTEEELAEYAKRLQLKEE